MNGPDKSDPPESGALADLEHLRDEMQALIDVMQGHPAPPPGVPRKPDSLSDEDAVEAGFDNLPL
jgi:hypothetical protein